MTAKSPSGSKRPFRMIAGVSTMSDLADGASAYGYPGNYPGAIYFVNNITGLSTNDGSDWEHAFAEVSQAITAAEAFRGVAGSLTTNSQLRNRIYVQGTGTPYTALTALPNHCDIIGVGASPYGNGTGIAQIGTTTGTGVANVATSRGVFFYNMQFTCGASASWCMNLAAGFLRGGFIGCSFLVAGTNTTGGCLKAALAFAGNLVERCQFSGDAGYPAVGIHLAGGGAINNNLFVDNMIGGSTSGVLIDAGDDINTVWKNNVVGLSYAGNATTIAVHDHSSGYAIWAGNFIVGSDAINSDAANRTKRFVGNYVIDTTTATIESATIAEGQST